MLQTGRSGCRRDSSLGEVLRERSGRTSGASEGMSVAAGEVSSHGRAPTGVEGDTAGSLGEEPWRERCVCGGVGAASPGHGSPPA